MTEHSTCSNFTKHLFNASSVLYVNCTYLLNPYRMYDL